VGGGLVGELLDIRTSLNNYHVPPWKRRHNRLPALGIWNWLLLVAVNLILGGIAAAVVYGQHKVATLNWHEILGLAAAGLSAPAVLQKFGGAVRK
jgi:hypothetical protein